MAHRITIHTNGRGFYAVATGDGATTLITGSADEDPVELTGRVARDLGWQPHSYASHFYFDRGRARHADAWKDAAAGDYFATIAVAAAFGHPTPNAPDSLRDAALDMYGLDADSEIDRRMLAQIGADEIVKREQDR